MREAGRGGQIKAFDPGQEEERIVEVDRPGEFGFREIGPRQIGQREFGAGDVCVGELGASQLRLGEVDIDEVAPVKFERCISALANTAPFAFMPLKLVR